jgi:hypothetical protein
MTSGAPGNYFPLLKEPNPMHRLSVCILAIACLATGGERSSPTVKQKTNSAAIVTTNKIDSTVKPTQPAGLMVNAWVGKQFILLEKVKMFRKFGYHLYTSPQCEQATTPVDSSIELPNHRLAYAPFENALATVIAVARQPDKNFLVTFTVASHNIACYGKTTNGIIEGIAPTDDLVNARKRWLGKTIYSRRRSLDIYDSAASQFTSVKVPIAEPLKVIAVRWGFVPLPPKPIWLVVSRPSGAAGIIPVHFTWTNVLPAKQTAGLPWQADVLEENPRTGHLWDEGIWDAIENHQILTGMTQEQVRLSWGDPLRIAKSDTGTKSAWTYERAKIIFFRDSLAGTE